MNFSTPEGTVPGAFGESKREGESIWDLITSQGTSENGGGFESELAVESLVHLEVDGQSETGTNHMSDFIQAGSGGFQTAQLSIGITDTLDLGDFADELQDQMHADLKFLQASFARSAVGDSTGAIDNNDHAVAALHVLGYLDGKDFLRKPSIGNNTELMGYFAKARNNLMNEMVSKHLKTLGNKFGDLQFTYATGGGRLSPKTLFKQQVKNLVYHHNNTSELKQKIYDEVIDVLETGATRL
ncbi:hypothetical protein [Microbulbifer thermotolerans]|uniref:hypothetical protein n=1 Tax=Microbulbifer thermotolerans TaxID=252514 RepID=UPI002248D30D|nr:hypothetical protein [Microbulbifer thermotolerans]MCX2832334.1 hypothetical protein [Microbulbifer thermotolerans]